MQNAKGKRQRNKAMSREGKAWGEFMKQLDKKTLRQSIMYISEILQYLIWPAFIFLAWISVKFVLSAYEKKFPEKE
jgi:hypothetical protein